jgi:hypothetical protein
VAQTLKANSAPGFAVEAATISFLIFIKRGYFQPEVFICHESILAKRTGVGNSRDKDGTIIALSGLAIASHY